VATLGGVALLLRLLAEAARLSVRLEVSCAIVQHLISHLLFHGLLRRCRPIAYQIIVDRQAAKFLNQTLHRTDSRLGFFLIVNALLLLLLRFFLRSRIVLREVLLKVDLAILSEHSLHFHLALGFVQADVLLVLVNPLHCALEFVQKGVHVLGLHLPRPRIIALWRVIAHIKAH